MDTPNADYDSVWKQAIERYWTDFTELFLLETWGSRPLPESQDQELARCARDSKLGLFRVDKLLRAPASNGQPCLWHIEIQVARQRGFAERMFVCQYRLYDQFRLPVRSIAILGDPSPTWRPQRFDLAAGGTKISFEFESVKLRDFDERFAELLLSDNVFSWLVVAHLLTLRTRREPVDRMIVKDSLLTGLRSCCWTEQKFRDVFDLVDRMMKLPKVLQDKVEKQQGFLDGRYDMAWKYLWEERAEERGMQRGMQLGIAEGMKEGRQLGLQVGLQEGRQEGLQEGRQEGLQEGRLLAMREMLCAHLTQRFGQFDEAVGQRINDAMIEDLERWCLAVVTARTIDEVF